MVKDLLIEAQYMENYGAHNWDGQGDCPQHWKCKGGEEYIVTNVPEGTDLDQIIAQLRPEVEWFEVGSQQYIVGHEIVESGYKTNFERDQEEFDGEIRYPAKRIDYNDLRMEILYA